MHNCKVIPIHRSYLIKLNQKAVFAREKGFSSTRTDSLNQLLLYRYIRTFGFPCFCRVGTDGMNAVWLLTQHSDNDINFQEDCLCYLDEINKICPRRTRVLRSWLAYLCDRIAINRGEPQRFGTQYFRSSDGKLLRRPCKNIGTLWLRRLWAGLPPGLLEHWQLRRSCETRSKG